MRACLFVGLLSLTAVTSLPRETRGALNGVRVESIFARGYAGSSVNVIAGLQHSLISRDALQYAAFYDEEGALVLAQRRRPGGVWVSARTAYRANVRDAHNTVAIGVDGAGFLHVAFDHHNQPLNYARSRAPGSLELGPKLSMTGRLEREVTYPAFLPLPGGDLLFFYRHGGSGRGDLVLNRYRVAEGTWTQVHANLVSGEGRRNAYVSTTVDGQGRIHAAWVWRETPDVATNHDLCYARSDDGGLTWSDSNGRRLPVPITADTAEYALRIPQQRSLMNPPAIAADEQGEPVLANYWAPEGSDVPQYHVVHKVAGRWRVGVVTARATAFVLRGTATKRPPLSRSILAVRDGRALLVFRDDEHGGRVTGYVADAPGLSTWKRHLLTREGVGAWEPSFDPIAFRDHGAVEMLLQRVEQNDGSDHAAAAAEPTPVQVLHWEP